VPLSGVYHGGIPSQVCTMGVSFSGVYNPGICLSGVYNPGIFLSGVLYPGRCTRGVLYPGRCTLWCATPGYTSGLGEYTRGIPQVWKNNTRVIPPPLGETGRIWPVLPPSFGRKEENVARSISVLWKNVRNVARSTSVLWEI